uniref:Uncharacterized protein n=1 Tax=Coccidioides posadasii RMSCC 3488 TaxID=454284 RepID=A0A0J6I4G8_COCPO|nr:hypothetical protein CPAG_02607 [Coccidioides posadasii RMSCC 3488]
MILQEYNYTEEACWWYMSSLGHQAAFPIRLIMVLQQQMQLLKGSQLFVVICRNAEEKAAAQKLPLTKGPQVHNMVPASCPNQHPGRKYKIFSYMQGSNQASRDFNSPGVRSSSHDVISGRSREQTTVDSRQMKEE